MAEYRNYANVALAAVTVGYFVSQPFSGTFAGGLVSSTCGAAMVGGLADWFAVTALFRKPLGIPWRTALIPRNREKIFRIITNMVEKELLTPDNVQKTLSRYNLGAIIVSYLADGGGKEEIKRLFSTTGRQFITAIDAEALGRLVSARLTKEAATLKLAPLVAEAVEWSVATGYDRRLTNFILEELARLLRQDEVPRFLAALFDDAQYTYEKGLARRKIFNRLAEETMDLTPQRFGRIVQTKLLETLDELRLDDHPLRRKLCNWIEQVAVNLKTDSKLQGMLERWKSEELTGSRTFREEVVQLVVSLHHNAVGNLLSERLDSLVSTKVDAAIEALASDPELQAKADTILKSLIGDWLTSHHGEIGVLVQERLASFTDNDLVAFVETKAGHDLQMIRINGSAVGGLVGMAIYLVNYCLSQVLL